jgi:hypothetical protein
VEEARHTYHIYLLTVWHEQPDAAGLHWRFRLVDPQTDIDYGFTSAQALPYMLQQLQRATVSSDNLQ